MKTVTSACFAALVLCGFSGCGRLCCRPLFPFLHHACTSACTQGCEATGIFNWSHGCDTCDHCANWTGEDIVAQTGDAYQPRYAGTPNRPIKHHHAKRAHPNAYHVTSRIEQPVEESEIVESTDETVEADQLADDTDEAEEEVVAKPVTTRRVRSTRPRSR
ncbi:MAG TPA: hypothetical protein VF306_16260 [Pirellulales bacterium]